MNFAKTDPSPTCNDGCHWPDLAASPGGTRSALSAGTAPRLGANLSAPNLASETQNSRKTGCYGRSLTLS